MAAQDICLARLELVVERRDSLYDHEDIVMYTLNNVELPRIGALTKTLHRMGIGRATQEVGWVLAFNDSLDVHCLVEVARGTTNELPIHLPTLLQAVIACGTDRFVFMHGHVTSSAAPSAADVQVTAEIAEAAALCGLRFEDHYIITGDPDVFVSMREAGLYEPST